MRRALGVSAIFALLCNQAAAYSSAADYLINEHIAEACQGGNGEIDPAAAIERDLTGNGQADFILSHEGISCAGGGESGFCGRLCRVTIYIRRGELLNPEREMLGRGVSVSADAVPTIEMHGLGGGPAVLKWNGQEFAPFASEESGADSAESGADSAGTAPAEEHRLNHEQIAEAQQLLNALGYSAGPADGLMGPKTRAAIAAFQNDAGEPASGELDGAVLEALRGAMAGPGADASAFPSADAAAAHQQDATTASGAASQNDAGEPASGELDGAVLEALRGAMAGSDADAFPSSADAAAAHHQDATTLSGAADLRADLSCSDRPDEAYTEPTVWPEEATTENRQHRYTDGRDLVRVGPDVRARDHLAGGGDDKIYVDGPEIGTQVLGENGGDTIIVCALGEIRTTISVGPYDLAADTIVIDESTFTELPVQNPEIAIHGINAANDRIIIRVPDGLEVSFGENLYRIQLPIRIGDVTVKLLPDLAEMALGETIADAVVIATANGRTFEIPSLGSALPTTFHGTTQAGSEPMTLGGEDPVEPLDIRSCPEPNEIASTAEPIPAFEGETPRYVGYGNGNDTVVITEEKTARHHAASAGEDTVYIYEPISGTTVSGGFGADQIVLCRPAVDGLSLTVELGGSHGMDIDADTLILAPEMFTDVPAGYRRRIWVRTFTPVNDRMILRLPPGAQVEYGDQQNGSILLRVGSTDVKVSRPDDWLSKPFDWNSIVLVPADRLFQETSRPAPAEKAPAPTWRWGTPSKLGGGQAKMAALDPGCAAMEEAAPEQELTQPIRPHDHHEHKTFLYYTHDADLIRISDEETVNPTQVYAGRGDDALYLTNVGDGLSVGVGSGADTIVVCSMRGIALNLGLGDRFPELVVIEPSVFLNVPAGIGREIIIDGFIPVNDRLELRVPQDMDVVASGGGGEGKGVSLQVGQVRIGLSVAFFGQGRLDISDLPIVIVPGVQQ